MTLSATRDRSFVGSTEPMPDAAERVCGTLRYTTDVNVESALHACIVASPVPHAEILAIDVEVAREIAGVVTVITGQDLLDSPAVPQERFGLLRRDQSPLAIGRVRHSGEPVALVVAATPQIARSAAQLVAVDYEPLPYVIDATEALAEGAPLVHPELGTNECGSWLLTTGDVDEVFANAARVFENTYYSPPASHVPFEPHTVVAAWEQDRLELWSSTQWPIPVRDELARFFELPTSNVRVHSLPLGGGFGAKSQVKFEPLAAAAARLVGLPLRLELQREQVYHAICKHAASVRLRTATAADGRILAREIDIVYNGGAYAVMTPHMVGVGLTRSPGPYRIPAMRGRARGAYTNMVPAGSFRGAMTNQVAFAYEAQLDVIAEELGVDPIELRRRNLLVDGDVYPTGQQIEDAHFIELLDNVSGHIGWGDPPAEPAVGWRTGKGVAVVLKTMPAGARTEVGLRLSSGGDLTVLSSQVDMGQGLKGTLAQLAAHHVGVPLANVSVEDPDTSRTPYDARTAASRSTYFADQAIRLAALDLRRAIGGELSPESDLVAAMNAAGLSCAEGVGEYVTEPSGALADPQNVHGNVTLHWHQGAVAVEVAVELETGRVELLRCHGAAWAGRVINAVRARLQSEGCIIGGIGLAMSEELLIDDGSIANPNFGGYMIPSILDVPYALTSDALESDDPDVELHGLGEMTIPAVAPAIANAIAAAVGVRLETLPFTAERVLRALEASTARGQPDAC